MWEVNACAYKVGALMARMAPAVCHQGMAHSVYPCPPSTSEPRDVCPFPEQSTGNLDLFRGQGKAHLVPAYADLCPERFFFFFLVALVPNFSPSRGKKMEKCGKGPAWVHHGHVTCQTTYGPPQLLPLPSVPGRCKPVNHGDSCALLSTANI